MQKSDNYEWLVGFIDGDGFLDLQRTKSHNNFYYKPILAITQKDFRILYKVRQILKVGRISKRSDGYYHYRVQSQKIFHNYLIPVFQQHSFLSNKKLQWKLILRCLKILQNYSSTDLKKQYYLNQYRKWIQKTRFRLILQVNSLSLPWFVGFFDSEGCISCQRVSQSFRFIIKITQSDPALLVEIYNKFKIGHINKERPNIYYWGVTSRKELPKLISIFKKYSLKSEKLIQWKKFLKLIRLEKIIKSAKPPSQKSQQRFFRLILSLA